MPDNFNEGNNYFPDNFIKCRLYYEYYLLLIRKGGMMRFR
jgi:hypothetical protein